MEIHIKDIESIGEAAKTFIKYMKDLGNVFAFYGKMGAGKTTFTKAICEALGVEDVITSPTFAIVNEYEMPQDVEGIEAGAVYHFDFYRVKKLEEAYDMGYDEYFYSNRPCFIEWPELIEELLPEDAVKVIIEEQPDGSRIVKV